MVQLHCRECLAHELRLLKMLKAGYVNITILHGPENTLLSAELIKGRHYKADD